MFSFLAFLLDANAGQNKIVLPLEKEELTCTYRPLVAFNELSVRRLTR